MSIQRAFIAKAAESCAPTAPTATCRTPIEVTMKQATATSPNATDATATSDAARPLPRAKPDSVRMFVMDTIQAYPLAAIAIVFAAGYVLSRVVQRFR